MNRVSMAALLLLTGAGVYWINRGEGEGVNQEKQVSDRKLQRIAYQWNEKEQVDESQRKKEEKKPDDDIRSLILAQPRIARVEDARTAESAGFIVLDAGSNKGLFKGDQFAVRRGHVVVARILISDTIHATQCVADIVPQSVAAGMGVKNGDEIIRFER